MAVTCEDRAVGMTEAMMKPRAKKLKLPSTKPAKTFKGLPAKPQMVTDLSGDDEQDHPQQGHREELKTWEPRMARGRRVVALTGAKRPVPGAKPRRWPGESGRSCR